jgi:hypothetical protein
LGKRDIVPNLNLFSKVVTDEAGKLSYVPGASPAGAVLELRFEMDTLVVLTACQHPLDPATIYAPRPVQLSVYAAPPIAPDDACLHSCPENERAYQNTCDYYALRA